MSDRSNANGRLASNGDEYFEDIPVTAEGSINMVSLMLGRRSRWNTYVEAELVSPGEDLAGTREDFERHRSEKEGRSDDITR